MLGCGEWHLVVTSRGGSRTIVELPWSQASFGHVIDDMSQCYIALAGNGCCDLLKEIYPFSHEVAAYRDNALDPDWAGPIVSMAVGSDSARIDARDVFQWFERRVIPLDRSFAEQDLTVPWFTLAQDALDQDPTPNIEFVVTKCGEEGSRSYLARDMIRVADELRELSRTAVDFTTRGRQIHVGGLELASPTLLLTDTDVRNATTTYNGLGFATEVIVTGAEIAGGGVRITSRANSGVDQFGLIQQVFREEDIKDEDSLGLAARSILKSRQPTPLFLSVTLAPECSHKYRDLRPGAHVDTRLEDVAGCSVLPQTMRMTSKATNIAASERGGAAEAIVITLSPIGLIDDAG